MVDPVGPNLDLTWTQLDPTKLEDLVDGMVDPVDPTKSNLTTNAFLLLLLTWTNLPLSAFTSSPDAVFSFVEPFGTSLPSSFLPGMTCLSRTFLKASLSPKSPLSVSTGTLSKAALVGAKMV